MGDFEHSPPASTEERSDPPVVTGAVFPPLLSATDALLSAPSGPACEPADPVPPASPLRSLWRRMKRRPPASPPEQIKPPGYDLQAKWWHGVGRRARQKRGDIVRTRKDLRVRCRSQGVQTDKYRCLYRRRPSFSFKENTQELTVCRGLVRVYISGAGLLKKRCGA